MRVSLRASTQWVAGLIKIWARDIWLIKMILDTDLSLLYFCPARRVFISVWSSRCSVPLFGKQRARAKWKAIHDELQMTSRGERENQPLCFWNRGCKNDAADDSPNLLLPLWYIRRHRVGRDGAISILHAKSKAAVKIHQTQQLLGLDSALIENFIYF